MTTPNHHRRPAAKFCGVREARSKAKKHFLPVDDSAVIVDSSSPTLKAIDIRFAEIEAAKAVAITQTLFYMQAVCAWCGLDLGRRECTQEQAGKVSHGICPVCRDKMGRELAAEGVKSVCV